MSILQRLYDSEINFHVSGCSARDDPGILRKAGEPLSPGCEPTRETAEAFAKSWRRQYSRASTKLSSRAQFAALHMSPIGRREQSGRYCCKKIFGLRAEKQ